MAPILNFPNGISAADLACGRSLFLVRACDHPSRVPCIEGHANNSDRCDYSVPSECKRCGFETQMPCHEHDRHVRTGTEPECENVVSKTCPHCKVHQVDTQCWKNVVNCEKEVKTILDCGHEVTWVCGRDEDARLQQNIKCKDCVLPQWKNAIAQQPLEGAGMKLWSDRIHQLVVGVLNEEVPEGGIKFNFDLLDEKDLGLLSKAREQVLRVICNLMVADEIDFCEPPPPVPPNGMSREHYDVVFMEVPIADYNKKTQERIREGAPSDEDLQKLRKTCFCLKPSNYGRGISAMLLTSAAVSQLEPADDSAGVDNLICVGLAFRFRALDNQPPFCTTPKQPKSFPKKAKQKANKLSDEQQCKGFDCVNVVNHEKKDTEQRIYWRPKAVIPVSLVRVSTREACMLCMDNYAPSDGVHCEDGHFVCWEDCFPGLVNEAKKADRIQRAVDKDGNLRCPEPSCAHTYSLQRIHSEGGSEEIFDACKELQLTAHVAEVLPKALAQERKRLTAEFQKISDIKDVDERKAARYRLQAIERILTLRCPRCDRPFHDFNGCWALTCRDPCRAGFCAYCLKDCGADAHGHVPSCPENSGAGVFGGDMNAFQAHHHRRQEKKLKAFINEKPEAVQKILRRILQPDVRGLGIDISPNARAQSQPQPQVQAQAQPAAAAFGGLFQNWF